MLTRTAVAVALVALPSAAAPSAASALAFEQADFMVSVKGVQTVEWTVQHRLAFQCDVNIDGEGTERTTFSSKPIKLTVLRVGRNLQWNGNRQGFPLRAVVKRQGDIRTSGGEVCSDGDGTGGTAPVPKDCGTKRTSAVRTNVEFGSDQRDLIRLAEPFGSTADRFANCPRGDAGWPALMTSGEKGVKKYDVGRRLPARDIFDESLGKFILRAGGARVHDGIEDTETAKVSWELTLVRVGAKRPR